MSIVTHQWRARAVGIFVASIVFSGAAFAQSDTDYLAALDTMVVDMDLDGLADQTFETQTVAAPQLSMLDDGAEMVDCNALLAQAEARGVPLEIFGADASLSQEQVAALSKCMMPDTGVVMSYLMTNP